MRLACTERVLSGFIVSHFFQTECSYRERWLFSKDAISHDEIAPQNVARSKSPKKPQEHIFRKIIISDNLVLSPEIVAAYNHGHEHIFVCHELIIGLWPRWVALHHHGSVTPGTGVR